MRRFVYLFITLIFIGSVWAQSVKTRIYIEPKIGERDRHNQYRSSEDTVDYSLIATKALLERCSDIVVVTTNQDTADYILRIQTGNSILFNKAGDAVYISHAARKLSNFSKDICGYVKTLPQK